MGRTCSTSRGNKEYLYDCEWVSDIKMYLDLGLWEYIPVTGNIKGIGIYKHMRVGILILAAPR